MNSQCGLLVNSSRGILYCSRETDFAEAASKEASRLQKEMSVHLKEKGIV
jgi:orotidine-5'-phosphate decarboxylase